MAPRTTTGRPWTACAAPCRTSRSCARCTRFADQIAGDPFIELLERGSQQQVGTSSDQPFDSYFSGNTVQICPVGALTDRDFRFQVRVWYLDTAKSICPGCARGCNIDVHVSRRRPHHNQGHRVARLKPRFNAGVNLERQP